MNSTAWAWIIFNAVVVLLLVADLTLFHRKPRDMRIREALGWSAFWVSLAAGLNVLIYYLYENQWMGFGVGEHALSGKDAALQFLTGYLIEQSLSVDNLFVFLAIFNFFHIRGHHQHGVLFWGILGAVILRAIMIFAGVALIEKFHWLMYLMGAFLILTGGKLAFEKGEKQVHPDQTWVLRLARRFLPVAEGDHGGHFFTVRNGKRMVTRLFLVLLAVESTDVVFAIDSIPAVLAITKDPFLVYTSNIMAILGLRAMFFALSGLLGLFHYLRFGLAGVLIFVGGKMTLPLFVDYHVPTGISLAVVATLLAVSILASIVWVKEHGLAEPKKPH
jgi:tellurite resistance protein TerC